MNFRAISAALAATLFLSGCFETAEEVQAREAQFNGQPIEQVEARIGPASHRNASTAIWQYSHSYRESYPIYGIVNGQSVIVNYGTRQVNNKCTFTASLSKGKVVNTQYEGNSCKRFAPPLDS